MLEDAAQDGGGRRPATVVRKDIDIMDYTCLQPPEEAEALSFRSTDNLLSRSFKIPAVYVIWRTNGQSCSVIAMPIACF